MNTPKSVYTHRFTTRLPDYQFQFIKAKSNPSDYIRKLIERDLVACNEKA
jgi:hypothetical protein